MNHGDTEARRSDELRPLCVEPVIVGGFGLVALIGGAAGVCAIHWWPETVLSWWRIDSIDDVADFVLVSPLVYPAAAVLAASLALLAALLAAAIADNLSRPRS